MKRISSVLIVDDSPDDCYLATHALNKSGAIDQVWSINDPRQVLDYFRDNAEASVSRPGGFPPTLIILDINMPGMTGFEFADALQARTYTNEESRPMVICMLTSSLNESDLDRALRHPLVGTYYPKPLTAENVAELLSKYGIEDS